MTLPPRLRILLTAAALAGVACASDAPIRGAAGDPSNPDAPESALSVVTIAPEAVPMHGTQPGGPPSRSAGHPPHAKPAQSADHQHGEHSAHGEHNKPSESPDAGTKAPTIYTCPMHPEIRQSEPGRCPKCGMKLVPQKQGSGQ